MKKLEKIIIILSYIIPLFFPFDYWKSMCGLAVILSVLLLYCHIKRLTVYHLIQKKKEIDLSRVPKHIAFIMDGNGRWAKKRGLPRIKGHEEGAKRLGKLANAAHKLGLEAVTLFAFSTENWKRPKEEVDFIFSLLERMLKELGQ